MGKLTGVKSAWLIVSKDKVYKEHAIIYEDGVITDIVPNDEVKGDIEIIDARDCIVSPGFINTHCHMYNVITRGKNYNATATSLKGMLEEWWWPKVEDQVDEKIIRASTYMACVDMLKCGITCVDDILEAPFSTPGGLELEASILEEAGMRGILSIESSERISKENGLACLQENYDFVKRQRERKSPVQGMMCVHTTFSCSPEFLRKGRMMAKELKGSIQLHCSEGPDEPRYCMESYGRLPMEHYEEIGFLDEDVLASQCVIMDPAELALMAKRKVRVSHQPVSNSQDGCGVAPIPDMLRLGIPIGIGTDGENNDMFESMRTALYVQRAKRINPTAISSNEVFHMATANGAKAIGYDKIGTLEVGMYADYITVKADPHTPINDYNVIDQLVRFRKSADITSVTVAGKKLVENGKVLTLDEEKVKKDCWEMTEEYWRRV